MTLSKNRFPQVEFGLLSGDNHRITSELLARDVDIAIVYDAPNHVQAEVFCTITSPIGVIMHPSHPLAHLEQVALGECALHPLIAPGKDWLQHSGLRPLLSAARSPFQIAASAERPGMLKSMVRSNLGVAFLNEIGVERELKSGSLTWVPLAKGTVAPSVLSVLIPRGRILPHYCLFFLEALKAELDKISDQGIARATAGA